MGGSMAADLRRTFRSRSAEETAALGEALGRRLGPGAVVALDGDLGAGKTVFVQGLARGLEIAEPVTSPSFTLMHEHTGRLVLHHFDAWLTGREIAFLEGGGAEALLGDGVDGVAAVEWAERVADWLPAPRLRVLLEYVGDGPDERRITIALVGNGGRGDEAGAGPLTAALERLEAPAGVEEADESPASA